MGEESPEEEQRRDDGLDLNVAPDRAPEINAALVRADIAVHALTVHERSLEDAFFDLTKEPARV